MLEIIQGDTLQLLRTFDAGMFDAGMFDAIITDPPYSCGGMTISEKQRPTSERYTNTKGVVHSRILRATAKTSAGGQAGWQNG